MPAHKALRRLAKKVAELRSRVEALKEEAGFFEERMYAAQDRASRIKAKSDYYIRDIDRRRSEMENVRYDIDAAMKELTRAKEYGDSYACDRAMKKLRQLTY